MSVRSWLPVLFFPVLLLPGCLNIEPLVVGHVSEVIVERSPRWIEFNRIAIIDIDGFISNEKPSWYGGSGTTVADVKEKLRRAENDSFVKAVLLRINSPGGEVTASDMLYQEVLTFKGRSGKPVVAVVMGLGASGAYYVACAADHIVVAPTGVTGSVGVVMHFLNVQGLFGKIGLSTGVVKSGEKKDIASPTRAMTEEERALLQEINNAMFARFEAVVRANRPRMTDEAWAVIRDGRIFVGEQALELHLVDTVGYMSDALDVALRLADISAADVILYRAFPHYNTNIYAGSDGDRWQMTRALDMLLKRHGAAFLYVWSPGL